MQAFSYCDTAQDAHWTLIIQTNSVRCVLCSISLIPDRIVAISRIFLRCSPIRNTDDTGWTRRICRETFEKGQDIQKTKWRRVPVNSDAESTINWPIDDHQIGRQHKQLLSTTASASVLTICVVFQHKISNELERCWRPNFGLIRACISQVFTLNLTAYVCCWAVYTSYA